MSERLVNDWSGTLSDDLAAGAGAGATIAVTPATPGLAAGHLGATARARVGTEIVTVELTAATAWTVVARASEDATRYPAQAWPAGTLVDLVLTEGGLTDLIVAAGGGVPAGGAANTFLKKTSATDYDDAWFDLFGTTNAWSAQQQFFGGFTTFDDAVVNGTFAVNGPTSANGDLVSTGAVTAAEFIGDGSQLINLDAGNITGVIPAANLPAAVAYEDAANTFTAAQTIGGVLKLTEQASPGLASADQYWVTAIDDGGVTRLQGSNSRAQWIVNQDNYIVARNTTGSTIPKFRAVRVVGGSGNRPTIGLADAASNLSAGGVTAASVANNGYVEVVTVGVITGVDTSAWAEGTRLYLGSSGVLTSTAPAYPASLQRVGVVLDSHATSGSVYISRLGDDRASVLNGDAAGIGVANTFTAYPQTVAYAGVTQTTVVLRVTSNATPTWWVTAAGGVTAAGDVSVGGGLTVTGTATAASLVGNGSGLTNLPVDFLSPLANAEVSVTGATTATVGRLHVCSGTSADYTVTLPTAVGNTGKVVGFRMAVGLTKLVTIDGNGSETVAGAASRTLWELESLYLVSNGTNWDLLWYRFRPMWARMDGGQQTIGTGSATKMNLVSPGASYNLALMHDDANDQINVRRTGTYRVTQQIGWGGGGAIGASANTQARIHFNGSYSYHSSQAHPSGFPSPSMGKIVQLNAGTTVSLYAFQATGTDQLTVNGQVFLEVEEILTW